MDLIVGASILIALVILVGGVLWLKESLVSHKMVSYTAIFPNVGTLQLGNPVMVNGVTKGRVTGIYLRNSRVATVMDIEKDVMLSDSCSVTAQNIGLMGERGIGIQLKEGGTRLKPTKKTDTTFLPGSFDTGIAEAMGMLGTVLGQVQVLLVNVSSIMSSTIGDTSFLRLFHTLVSRLDTLTFVAEKLVKKNGPLIDNSMQNLSSATTQLKDLLDKNSGHIDAIMANGESLTSYSLNLMTKIETLTASIQGVVSGIEKGEGPLGMMLKDKQFASDLKRTVANVDTLVTDVQSDALKLRIKINVFGSGKKKSK
jgi:phospholipid/cholesterol/gamma-HCH transport system substrate-binding protein